MGGGGTMDGKEDGWEGERENGWERRWMGGMCWMGGRMKERADR